MSRDMNNITVIGAGRSISGLLQYFNDSYADFPVSIQLYDYDLTLAAQKAEAYSFIAPFSLDVSKAAEVRKAVRNADAVVSMVPAHLHAYVAEACLEENKNLFTASYISEAIQQLDEKVREKGLLFLMECGLDPGIDHMSAQKEIDAIKSQGGRMESFKSYTGGLIAPESDDNPWHYKFTWNPRNVVLAGTGVVKFVRNGNFKYIPYHELFQRVEKIHVEELGDEGEFEAYANRDSLRYRNIYGIDTVPTILRGTLRRPGFCESWNILVQLGMTDDSYTLTIPENYKLRDFTNSFLAYHSHFSVEDKLCMYFDVAKDSELFKKLEWMGLFSEKELKPGTYSPAEVLQSVLEEKWALKADDKDMVVMQHQFMYWLGPELKEVKSSMYVIGKDASRTSMSQTVGLPLAMAVRLFLEGKINLEGVCLPTDKSVYEPILSWLEKYDVTFKNVYLA